MKRRSNRYSGATCMLVLLAASTTVPAQQSGVSDAERERQFQEKLTAENPLAAGTSLWIEELTYIEVRDRIADGDTTAIISTGGIEENGPYVVTGKHNVILRSLCPAIAASLGNALCAPIVPFVPEGNFDPPSRAMLFPGSFGVRDETFHALLVDIGNSLKLHGFRNIVLIGDSGGNQRGMSAVADDLNEQWKGTGVSAHFVVEFYNPGWELTENYTRDELGVDETQKDGYHDDIWVTAMMMVDDPETVRYQQRVDAELASINGVDISSLEDTVELGRKMIQFRAEYTAKAISAAVGQK